MAGKANHRGFGYVRKLPSKRYQGSYIGPDLARYSGLTTFATKGDSEAWLAAEHRLISMGEWTAPKARRLAEERVTFGQAAMICQHAAKGRDSQIAAALSELVARTDT